MSSPGSRQSSDPSRGAGRPLNGNLGGCNSPAVATVFTVTVLVGWNPQTLLESGSKDQVECQVYSNNL